MNNEMKEKLMKTGIDVDDAVERLGIRSADYDSFLDAFFEDDDYKNLGKYIKQENWDEALSAAEILTGMAANLSMDKVLRKLNLLEETMKNHDPEDSKERYLEFMEQCYNVAYIIHK